MISVDEALTILAEYPLTVDTEILPFESALGRISAEAIRADRDFPAYNRVAMDGIAINSKRFAQGQRIYKVEKTIPAGTPSYQLKDGSACVEIMTGAVLSEGCDTVIPYEEIDIENHHVTIRGDIQPGQNVHHQGADRKAGDLIVPEKTLISAVDIGIAATVGKTHLKVYRKPAVCLISTGDELISVDHSPEPHQIRSSNIYALKAALSGYYGTIEHRHLPDNEEVVKRTITHLLEDFQILIFVGGSSMGKFDFLPKSLRAEGIEEHFYKIQQRPGKPFWFGHRDDRFVFSLPGNPVSSYLCLEKYFKFWLNKSLGLAKLPDSARLTEDYRFKPDLTYFLQVKLMIEDGVLLATPLTGGGSGDHANLADVSGFLELPQDRTHFKAGESFNLIRFR
ncbi:MAG: molybdopterin molybdotransferase MoeA [Saprospiraceae bacterium]|nr:molybdopterin molybdotransferase MoeA [Saprospiraceae bacterium]